MKNKVLDVSSVSSSFIEFTNKLLEIKIFARNSSIVHRVFICKLIDVLVDTLLDIKEDLSHEKNETESEKK